MVYNANQINVLIREERLMKEFFIRIILFCIIVLLPYVAFGWTPPSGSPLANGDHPRLMFITDSHRTANPNAPGMTVSEMRTRLVSSDYKSTFQSFINEMDGHYSDTPGSKSKMECTMDAISYAFLYILDPSNAIWASNSITFGHSQAEYGDKAKTHALYIASQAAAITGAETRKQNWSDYKTFNYGGGDSIGDGATNVSLAIVSDWCNSLLSTAEKEAIIDGVIGTYDYSGVLGSNEVWASGKHFGAGQNGGGILGLWGDGDISSYESTKVAAMMGRIEDNWLKSFRDLSTVILGGGSNFPQGPWTYDMTAIENMMPFVLILQTALNENLFNTVSYLRYHHYYSLYIVKPMKFDGDEWHIVPTDDSGTKAISTMDWGKNEIAWYPIISHLSGDEASVAKWTKDTHYIYDTGTSRRYRGVLYYFFSGYADVSAKSPSTVGLPLSKDIGKGQYMLRSGFESESDTLITFRAPEFHLNDGAHAHRDFGAFRIFKYGNLVPTRQIAKKYTSNVMITQSGMFNSIVGVLKSGELRSGYNVMGYRSGYDSNARYATDAAFQTNGNNHVGIVVGDELNGAHYDYIDYDYSNSWDDFKVDYAEREFVYLRSEGGTNDEYIAIFDRINAVDSSYTKYWLLQANFEPKLLENDGDEITMTAQDYPGDPDGGGGRWINTTSSPTQDNTLKITNTYDTFHGSLFNRTLLPSSFQINKVGGPNHYWEDAIGKSVETPASLTDTQKNHFGSYTMQIQSTTGQNYDNFLNVMEIGDNNTLTQMTEVTKITVTDSGSDVRMHGALIKDNSKNRVVLFSADQSGAVVTTDVNYSVNTSTASIHLLFKLQPNTMYSVDISGIGTSQVQSSGIGTLMFVNSSGSPHDYSISVSGTVGVYPAPPTDIELSKATTNAILTWNLSEDDGTGDNDVRGYKIYRSSDNIQYTSITITESGVTTYTDSSPEGIKYYKVAAVDSSGNESSLEYQPGLGATFSLYPPSAPTGLEIINNQ